MTVYHINKAIGRASSGVEYAQSYRFDLVRDFFESQFFIFCDHIGQNFLNYTEAIGIDSSFVLNVHRFMAGQENHFSTLEIADFVKTLPEGLIKIAENQQSVTYKLGDIRYKIWLWEELGTVDRVDFIVNQKLMEVAYYSDRLTHIDYYEAYEVRARYFFDEDGKLSMRQFYEKGDISLTFLDDLVLQGRNAFYQVFFERLKLSTQDLVIFDRSDELADAVFPQRNGAKIVVVVHAEHYSASDTTEDWVLWNNFYEYVFTNCDEVDEFIVSTKAQENRLREHFERLGKSPQICTIPVGSVKQFLENPKLEQQKYKMITASRLAAEKHVDILIKAVAKAKKELSELEFHIYGTGKFEQDFKKLIKKLSAENYIFLRGHQNMVGEYEKFGAYLSASGSEGFGLSLLEAFAHGLPMIGLRVEYGNTTFVKTGVNGILLEPMPEKDQVEAFAQAIVSLTEQLDYSKAMRFAREKSEAYLEKNVRKQWKKLYARLLRNGEETR